MDNPWCADPQTKTCFALIEAPQLDADGEFGHTPFISTTQIFNTEYQKEHQ